MSEPFTIDADRFSIDGMAAKPKFHLARKARPIVTAMRNAAVERLGQDATVISNAMGTAMENVWAAMSREDADYLMDTCLACVKVERSGTWAAIWRNGSLMFDDLNDPDKLMSLVWRVIDDQLHPFSRAPS